MAKSKKKKNVENFAQDSKQADIKQEPAVSKEDAKISFKVYGQDFNINDSDLIDYYRTRMKIMVMRFMLVGRFDDEGVYKIKDEIKYDLIRMNKEISDSGDDFYRAEARFITKFFYFDIKIEKLDEQKAKASLYLSEYVDEFLEEGYIVSHIADYTDTYDESFKDKVMQVFNLYDTAIKNDEFKMPSLAVLMQDEYDIYERVGGLYDIASQIYVMRMLKLLETSTDSVCQEIIRRYKELILDKSENENDEKNKYTKYKALLDRAIDEKGGLERLNVNKESLKSIVGEVNKSVKAINGLQKHSAGVEVMKPDKSSVGGSGGGKSKPKKKVAGKGGNNKGSKSSKKSDKKEDASKKEDKKDKEDKIKTDAIRVLSAYQEGERVKEEARKYFQKIKELAEEEPQQEEPQQAEKDLLNKAKTSLQESEEEEELEDSLFVDIYEDEERKKSEEINQQDRNLNEEIPAKINLTGGGNTLEVDVDVSIEIQNQVVQKDIEGEIDIELE